MTASHNVQELAGGYKLNLYERRSVILKKQAEGFSDTEIVKDLWVDYGIPKNNTWHDLRTKPKWSPRLQDMNLVDMQHRLRGRGEYLFREAAFKYRMSTNDCVKQGWFSRMQLAYHDLLLIFNPQIKGDEAEHTEITLTWINPKHKDSNIPINQASSATIDNALDNSPISVKDNILHNTLSNDNNTSNAKANANDESLEASQ